MSLGTESSAKTARSRGYVSLALLGGIAEAFADLLDGLALHRGQHVGVGISRPIPDELVIITC